MVFSFMNRNGNRFLVKTCRIVEDLNESLNQLEASSLKNCEQWTAVRGMAGTWDSNIDPSLGRVAEDRNGHGLPWATYYSFGCAEQRCC